MKPTICLTTFLLTSLSSLGAIIFVVPPEPILFFNSPSIDIDGNGSIDFQFGGLPGSSAAVITDRANRYLGIQEPAPNSGGIPFPLEDNTTIGGIETPMGLVFLSSDSSDGFVDPDQTTGSAANLYLCVSSGCSGLFLDESESTLRGLLGVQFESDDGVHFGYFDIETTTFGRDSVVNGWAYESEPNTPIRAQFVPEPSSLFLVFLGTTFLFGRRR
ncbi:PEP-CTERM sorting domain-containing protein [bacterium]|nr:PEP-CTERM sorting domain-containing protein [bacterium]